MYKIQSVLMESLFSIETKKLVKLQNTFCFYKTYWSDP